MKILAVSDEEVSWIHSPALIERCADVDLIISCGDLPFDYLEYIVACLNKPAYFVHGNHDPAPDRGTEDKIPAPEGWVNLDLKRIRTGKLRLAGLNGCMRYKQNAQYQVHPERPVAAHILVGPRMAPGFARTGHGADIMVTHAPMRGIHDANDLAHIGFEAHKWLAKTFKPRLWLHGHQHRNYNPLQVGETQLGNTRIVNVHPYRILELEDGWNV